HWDLAPLDTPLGVPVDAVWQRARPFSLGRVEVRGLGAEDLLVHLAHHAIWQHGFTQGLRPLVDAAWVLAAGPGVDGARLRAIAVDSGTPRAVTLLIGLAVRFLGAPPVPGYADACPVPLLETAMADVLAGPESGRIHQKLARAAGGQGVTGALRLAAREVMVPRGELARIVGRSPRDPLLPLFYGVRVLQLARQHGGSLARRLLRRDPEWAQVPARHSLYTWIEDPADP
ncbi:MAG: nucleotidyltransferase family protein, partial [Vicinamibacterales bacterium]